MALTYSTYVAALVTMTATTSSDPNFQAVLPDTIDYAEQRIYRELDLISTVTVDDSVTLASGNRNATIPDTFIVTNGFNVLTPAGATASTGARVPLTPVSRDVLDMLWPGNASTGVPKMFAMITQWDLVLGPAPDGPYVLETIGTQRPTPLSATNTTTFLSQYLPDLFLAASMIFMSGYQRNFSSTGNDPQMPVNWESQYEKLLTSAETEESRKKYASSGWASLSPQPLAGTPR